MRDLPVRDGVTASSVRLPAGPWPTLLEALAARFPEIGRARWHSRMLRGLVLDECGERLGPEHPHAPGRLVRYYRELEAEQRLPFAEFLIEVGPELVVADKPHFLPVTPGGARVAETLLARLIRRLGNPALVPLHRLDRATAGLVLFSANPATRARYQALFRERRIEKEYEALAPPMPARSFPLTHTSRLERGEPFFRRREVAGVANATTRIERLGEAGDCWRYRLWPITGRTHQLRVHMAALGAPIVNDPFYPELAPGRVDDHARPLMLLARALRFTDPLSGEPREFRSLRELAPG
jgi:tRNA pseudouridine32 synthase / 23S rRNA pseudouridine746 synthase